MEIWRKLSQRCFEIENNIIFWYTGPLWTSFEHFTVWYFKLRLVRLFMTKTKTKDLFRRIRWLSKYTIANGGKRGGFYLNYPMRKSNILLFALKKYMYVS